MKHEELMAAMAIAAHHDSELIESAMRSLFPPDVLRNLDYYRKQDPRCPLCKAIEDKLAGRAADTEEGEQQ